MVPPASVDPIGLLRLALDPAALLTAAGLTPDPWQQQLLRCQARQVLLVGSRQAGKSTAVAALALHTALFRRRSLTLLLSPSLRQSAELLRKVVDLHRAVGSLVPARFQSQTRLELANESRVISLPSREETVRSFSNVGLLLLDEAARIPDELYRAVRPMLAASRGRIICLSTPFGQRGFFWHEWTAGGPAWQRFRVGVGDCPRISPEFLAEERRALGDSWVRQEYECSFESLEGLVFPDFEQRCGVDDGPDGSGRPWVGGIDFGFRNPFAAVWGFTDADDVLWIVGERYARERPLHEHLPHLPRQVVWYADPTGRQEI
ncbi:MAG: terminase family protein [Gemmataceae bacterium]|nr:terminase family protein [Gemmataceae bacterium]MDW8265161.1 terminase family protein [Gemmataceae bacterium]